MKLSNIYDWCCHSIWRYLVKSMCGEKLEEVFAFAELMGNRVYGIIKGSGKSCISLVHTAGAQEGLLLYPRYKNL